MSKPVLFCYDGSDHSHRALAALRGMLTTSDAVVLTVWQPLVTRLAESGGFGVFGLENEGEIDSQEEAAARTAADEGAAEATAQGWKATARVEEATEGIWRTIVDVADELDAAMIVCGNRGRGTVRSALLGSVSHAVLQNAHRPVLVSPEPRS